MIAFSNIEVSSYIKIVWVIFSALARSGRRKNKRELRVRQESSAALAIYSVVSMQKMNACIKLENKSKYTLSTAGTPTCRMGIEPSSSPAAPGSHANSAWDAVASAA
jgi:hypothetical protein